MHFTDFCCGKKYSLEKTEENNLLKMGNFDKSFWLKKVVFFFFREYVCI